MVRELLSRPDSNPTQLLGLDAGDPMF